MDDLDAAAQPRCPTCDVVMRDEPDRYACPVCGRQVPMDQVAVPPSFDGPAIRGG